MSDAYVTLLGIGVQTFLYLLGGYGLVLRNDWSNKAMKEQIVGIQLELKGLATVVTALAVQDERLDNQGKRLNDMDRKIEALRRGEGFVAGARGIEKEY